jgi:zinc transport system substrate-binding protein
MKSKSAPKAIRLKFSAMLNLMQKNRIRLSKLFLFFSLLAFFAMSDIVFAKETIFVSIPPQKFFVEQIAGDLFDVEILVGAGMSPHAFEPLPRQMASLGRARAFMAIGLPFEQALLARIVDLFPQLKIIRTDQGITRRRMATSEETSNHVHHEGCDHGVGAEDPHIWLDPMNAKIMAENITNALSELFPETESTFRQNCKAFARELDSLTEHVKLILQPFAGQAIIVFHPAFGYFTDRYGLRQQAVEIEGKEPGPRQLAALIRKCRKDGIRIVFVQKQFPVAAAQVIARAISGSVVQIDPLAEDYVVNLKAIAEAVLSGNKP